MFSAASNTLMISAKQRILLPAVFHISGGKWCFGEIRRGVTTVARVFVYISVSGF